MFMFPVSVKLSAEDCLTLLEQPDLLARLGFDIQDFGGNTVVVNALPEGYPASEEAVKDPAKRRPYGIRIFKSAF